MSRRFGRNQKRRMREQIAAAEISSAAALGHANMMRAMLELERGLLHETSEKLHSLTEFFSLVANRVGKYATIAGPMPAFMKNAVVHDRWRVPVMPPVSAKPFDFTKAGASDMAAIQEEILRLLDVDVVRDHFAHQMAIKATLADQRIGYMISESAIRKMSLQELTDRLAPMVAQEIARELAQAVQMRMR